MRSATVRSVYSFARSKLVNNLFIQGNLYTKRPRPVSSHCSRDTSNAPDEHSAPVNQLSSSAQARVLELITQFKEGPHFKNTKGLRHIVQELEQWAKDNNSKPKNELFNFLSHICIKHGSAQDIDMLTSFAKAQRCSLTDGHSNLILSAASHSATIDRVKETLKELFSDGTKVRVNTQTDLLQRAINERDFPFVMEIIDLMKEDGNFPSSTRVMDNVIGACVGVEGDEAVRVVESVMGMHNHCRRNSDMHEVEQSTAQAFTAWIRSLPEQYEINAAAVNKDSVCQSCGEQLPCNDLSVDEYSQLLRHFEDNVKVEAGTESEREQSIVQALGRIAKEKVGNPYGAVLDGLNIVHDQWFSRYDRSDPLIDMAKLIVRHTGKEVLLIGRRHMTSMLLKKHERQGNQRQAVDQKYQPYGVHTFLLPNSVRDDYYLLYAALAMSKDTLIVSNDEFGDKACNLPWELSSLFMKWQKGRQVRFKLRNWALKLKYPSQTERVVQQSKNSWHLPLITMSRNNWLCVCRQT